MGLISRKIMDVRPQEIGKIKLGGRGQQKKTTGGSKMYLPEKYDHFEVVTRARKGGDGAFVRDEAVHKAVGDKPRELEGYLMFPEVEQNLHTAMVHYAGRKPSITCDGEVQRNAKGKESPCSRLAGDDCPCRPYARLQLQLKDSPHTGGYYVFRTRSWESTNNIQTALEELHARFGTLFQAPVKLITYESEDNYTVDGQERVGRSWKVGLVLNMDYEGAAELMVGAKKRLEVARERLMLTAGEVQQDLADMDEREAGEIADEFSPPKGLEASLGTQEKLDEVVEGLEPVEAPADDEEPEGPVSEDDICPTTGESCEHACEMECYLEADDRMEPEPEQHASPDDEERKRRWLSPSKMSPPDLKEHIRTYRDAALELDLLDAEAERYIEQALHSRSRKHAEKVLWRLYEIIDESNQKLKEGTDA